MRKLHATGAEQLEHYFTEEAEKLIATLRDVSRASRARRRYQARRANRQRHRGRVGAVLAQCDERSDYAADNYFPFMMASYQAQRPLLLNCLGLLNWPRPTATRRWCRRLLLCCSTAGTIKSTCPWTRQHLGLQWLPDKWQRHVRSPGKRARQAFQRSAQVF